MNAIPSPDRLLPAHTGNLTTGGAVRAIVPANLEDAFRIANAVVKASMAPPGLDTAEKCMVAIMHGMEVGLTPMAALQSIAVINNRPTIWGDGALALVRASGLLEWIEETTDDTVAICRAKRRGDPTVIERRFSDKDAAEAGLLTKAGPWKQYKGRMRQMRARSWTLRDGFADVLRGLSIAEEVQDSPMRDVTPSAPMLPPSPPSPPSPPPAVAEAEVEEGEPFDASQYFHDLEDALAVAMDEATVEEVWAAHDPEGQFDGDDTNLNIANVIKARRLKHLADAELNKHPMLSG